MEKKKKKRRCWAAKSVHLPDILPFPPYWPICVANFQLLLFPLPHILVLSNIFYWCNPDKIDLCYFPTCIITHVITVNYLSQHKCIHYEFRPQKASYLDDSTLIFPPTFYKKFDHWMQQDFQWTFLYTQLWMRRWISHLNFCYDLSVRRPPFCFSFVAFFFAFWQRFRTIE